MLYMTQHEQGVKNVKRLVFWYPTSAMERQHIAAERLTPKTPQVLSASPDFGKRFELIAGETEEKVGGTAVLT